MVRRIIALSVILVFVFLTGCTTHIHQVGSGATGNSKELQRQWYILWGLVPLNDVDTNAMAAGATDYTIQTQSSFVDIVIGIFTGFITIHPRSVTVTK